MNNAPEDTFRVVGVKTNGERTVLSSHASREIAEQVLALIRCGSDFREFHVEPIGGRHSGKPRQEITAETARH